MRHKIVLDADGLPTGRRTQIGVYGTLKFGHNRHGALGMDCKFLGTAAVKGLLVSQGEHPMLVKQRPELEFRPGNQIAVQVYDISADRMRILDNIEGHPWYFKREIIESINFGDFFVYYGDTEVYLKGEVDVIPGNIWDGAGTFVLKVDFKDGTSKPHFRALTPNIILPPETPILHNTETGEVIGGTERKSEIIHVPQQKIHNSPFSKVVDL